MLPKIPYIIYFIALLILVLPSFIMKNNKIGVFIKKISPCNSTYNESNTIKKNVPSAMRPGTTT